jgi:hypothetical protein
MHERKNMTFLPSPISIHLHGAERVIAGNYLVGFCCGSFMIIMGDLRGVSGS